jgi:hypothetical protein
VDIPLHGDRGHSGAYPSLPGRLRYSPRKHFALITLILVNIGGRNVAVIIPLPISRQPSS